MTQEYVRITDETRLVLGDWVRGFSEGSLRYYRLGMWWERNKTWGLFEDGRDLVKSSDTVIAWSKDRLVAFGFELVVNRLSMPYAEAQVYWLPPDTERLTVLRPGVEPR